MLLNVSAVVLPLIAGVWVVPQLLGALGSERFGFLSIGWILVGYFSILDLGLSKGLTQHIAVQRGKGVPEPVIAGIVGRVRFLLVSMGLGWAVVIVLSAPWLVDGVLKMPLHLQGEAHMGLMCLAATVPALMWTNASVGTLEGHEKFVGLSVVRIGMGLGIFLVPWAISMFTPHVGIIFAGLFAVRFGAALILAGISSRFCRLADLDASQSHVREIMRFGSWFTISNVVGQSMTYIDRLMIASMVSVAAVTYYTVPMDALARLPALPLAMMGVLMPGFAVAFARREASGDQVKWLYATAVKVLIAGWLPLIVALGLWGDTVLTEWVGEQMARESLVVWQILAIGVLVNGFSHIPYALLQSLGRTDIIAKIHLAEVTPYMLCLWLAISRFGIAGAAAVWATRMGMEMLLFYGFAWRQAGEVRTSCYHAVSMAAAGVLVLLLLSDLVAPIAITKLPYAMSVFALVIVVWGAWHVIELKSIIRRFRDSPFEGLKG